MWPATWETEEERVRAQIAKWQGSMAEPWAYTVSHGQFLLRLHRQTPESLFIWCKNCRNVRFGSSWQKSDIQLEGTGSGAVSLTDDGNLNVSCASVHVTENDSYDVEPLFNDFNER